MAKNTLKVIRLLMDHKEESFSIRQIAKKLKMNYKIAYEEVMKINKLGMIQLKKQGYSNQCSFEYKLSDLTFKVEEVKRDELLSDKNMNVLYTRIKEISDPFFICLIFGSYAKGTAGKQSDIDVGVISDNKHTLEEIKTIVNITPLNIHLVDFTAAQFLGMLETMKWNVGKEIKKHNIILKGVEPFYELMNDVG